MPCICYGAISGQEELDAYLKTPEGARNLAKLKEIADRIKKHRIDIECRTSDFHDAWIEAFEHMLNGCPERPKDE